MLAATSMHRGVEGFFPERYRSLITLMALAIIGSLVSSFWLLPSRLERVAVAVEQGAPAVIRQELDRATKEAADPGEVRALVDAALTIGSPELAASILDRLLVTRPNSVEGLRLLLEVQRQRHLMRDVAALDERVYALTGDVDALRDAADIYASRHMAAERVDALQRLNVIGHASADDIAELTHRLSDAGEGTGALKLLMAWLSVPRQQPLTAELVGLAAGLSAKMSDAQTVASRLGALIGRDGQIGPLHVLIQTYAERGHPELSLLAGYALGDDMTARPDVALVLAQLESLQGNFAAARDRLDGLARAGKLLPAGFPMLAELTLQAGDLRRAVSIVASLAPDQIAEGLPHRLVEAIEAAGRADLLIGLPIERIAASSPASAASVALAQGDRARAATLARAALAAGGNPADFGPAFGHAVQALGLEHEAIARLLLISQSHPLNDESLTLLIQLVENSRAELPSLLATLLRQRDDTPRAGLVWSMLAAHNGQSGAVVSWLKVASPHLPAQGLIDLLVLASERRDPTLAQAAAAALMGRTNLPAGWTQDEIALTRQSNEPLTVARFRSALDLVGGAQVDAAARDRIGAILLATPHFAQVAQLALVPASDPAIVWLKTAIAAGGSPTFDVARLTLLTIIAPGQALPLLADRLAADRQTLIPLHVAALVRTGQAVAAQTELRSFLRDLSPGRQDAKLQETLALLPPNDALAVIRIAASTTGRADWVAAYDEALVKAGLIDELRASLRARALAAGGDTKQLQALASRLVDLNDRNGAVAVMLAAAAGKKPSSPEVEQLMYLWGPRDAPDAVAWTTERALSAPLAEMSEWLEHLAYLGDPSAVISVAERHPTVFAQSAAAVRTYGAALVAAHTKTSLDLRSAVASASAPDQLTALAQLALDTKQPAVAWEAARAATVARPRNKETLLLAAQAAAAVRRSDDAASLYLQVLATGPQPAEIYVDAGDALISAKRAADGRKILAMALSGLPADPATVASARTKARAFVLLGRYDEASALLTSWLARLPTHAGLKADILQLQLTPRRDDRG